MRLRFFIIYVTGSATQVSPQVGSKESDMAEKSPGTAQKKTSSKREKALVQGPKAVTPIDAGTVADARQFQASAFQDEIEREIRRRAYELFEERGRREGFAHEDWARAEAEVLSRYQRGKSA